MSRLRLQLTFVAFLAAIAALALPAGAAASSEFPLHLEATGNGEGAFGCKVNGGPLEECEAEYPEGTHVKVLAEPETGSEFVAWEGDCSGSGACEVEISGEKTIEATFSLEEFELTTQTEGNGEGALECQVNGGPYEACAESETYPYGTEVTLFAEPEEGSEFVEWGGDCSGVEAECTLTVEEKLSVTATFAQEPPFEFTVTHGGAGSGTVECEVEGGGPEACEAEYEEGTELTLVASPETGSEFKGFSSGTGSAAGCAGTSPCSFTIEEDSSVKATFDPKPVTEALTVEVEGPGAVSGPEDINCPGVCGATFNQGQKVTLSATPSAHARLLEWTGSGAGVCAGTHASTCEVEMDAAKTVKAIFAKITHSLTVNSAGSGSGSVSCDGGACASTYEEGTQVTLTATAASGSTFAGWSGAGCSGTGNCVVTLNADTTVTATFAKNEEHREEHKEEPGTAQVATTAQVSSGKAALKLSCSGGACQGSLQLTAKVKSAKKTKILVIGRGSFSLPAGASITLTVKITNGQVKKELSKGRTIKAQLKGSGIKAATVTLKPAKKKHKRDAGR